MKKDPKQLNNGLVAWREYGYSLTEKEVAREIRKYGNEGLQYVGERNSETVLMFCSNEGFAFPEWRLLALHLRWQRSPNRHAQLVAQAKAMIEQVGRGGNFVSFSERMKREVERVQS